MTTWEQLLIFKDNLIFYLTTWSKPTTTRKKCTDNFENNKVSIYFLGRIGQS